MKLYAVHPEYWSKLDVPYAKNWPAYRAPTGITSGNREQVRSWLAKFLREPQNIDRAITELTVPAKSLAQVLASVGWPHDIDVLQIDAEGCDDQVVYHSDLDMLSPKVIAFEAKSLTTDKLAELEAYLTRLNYKVGYHGKEGLAIAAGMRVE
jgi:hypothetical protein